ncbi:MAG: hypothetical protein IT378_01895 [Sandaracinaceae bacterium]|nr:hypothetical protein [Sandaracinaceae bacterium]
MRASLLLALALGGCGSSSVLVVDVLTDYTSDEVALVRTTVLADGHAPITSEESRPILTGSLAPVRVAGIERVPTGAHRIEVELLDAWSRRIDRGVVIARVTLTSQVIVRIERGCASRAMRCGDGEVCSRGRCEPERCTAEPRPLDCSPPCASDAECGASSGACGVARCVSGS